MDELIKEALDLLDAVEHSPQEDTRANRQCDELTLLHIRKAKEWQGMKKPFKPPEQYTSAWFVDMSDAFQSGLKAGIEQVESGSRLR